MSQRSRGRRAYPGTPVDQILPLINLAVDDTVKRCIADTLVDRRRLGEITDGLRTPERFEVRPEGKYGEGFAAAVALCLVGLAPAEISTQRDDGTPREKPDLLVSVAGAIIAGVEVTRVDSTYPVRAKLFAIQQRIATLLADDPGLKPGFILGITVEYAPASSLIDDEWDRLAEEVLEFFRLRKALHLSEGDYSTIFASGSVAARCGTMVEIGHSSRSAILTLARASDRMAPYDDILQAIERKGGLAYDRTHPLWLVVEVSDPRGPFTEALEAVAAAPPGIDPFERVVVQDGYSHIVLT